MAYLFQAPGQLWFRGQYLLGWSKSANLPALVTTSLSDASGGKLGESDTSVLFGDTVAPGARSGMRLTLGYWFCPCQLTGIEVNYTFFGSAATNFSQSSDSDGSPLLARPFYNMESAAQDSWLISYPNRRSGSIDASVTNEFNSLALTLRQAAIQQPGRQIDLLVGYRYAYLGENVSIDETTTVLRDEQLAAGTIIQLSDRFHATNSFHGVDLGVSSRHRCNRLTLELLAKLGIGETLSRTTIDGSSTVTEQGQAPVPYDGGLLALPTNINTYSRNSFGVLPEFGITLGYDINPNLRATFGYTFEYWNNVMRAGDQIDVNLNTSQMLGGTLNGVPWPVCDSVLTDYWVQSLNFGFDYRF